MNRQFVSNHLYTINIYCLEHEAIYVLANTLIIRNKVLQIVIYKT
jgi:hypothetical protein